MKQKENDTLICLGIVVFMICLVTLGYGMDWWNSRQMSDSCYMNGFTSGRIAAFDEVKRGDLEYRGFFYESLDQAWNRTLWSGETSIVSANERLRIDAWECICWFGSDAFLKFSDVHSEPDYRKRVIEGVQK
jgi:hypothetical protein